MTPLAASLVHRLPKDGCEPCRFITAERGGHERASRWGEWVRSGIQEDIKIVASRWRRERQFGLRLDALESRGAGHRDKVSVVESAEEVVC